MDYKNETARFIDSVLQGIGPMDISTLEDTVSWFAYDPLIANSWSRRILKMIDDLGKTSLSKKAIAELFPNLSELRCKAWFELWMAKFSSLSKDERIKISNFYLDLLNAISPEDPYAFKKNIIHTPEEVSGFIKKLKPAKPEIARKLGRLVNACYHLGHAAYSDMNPSIVYENYGPYDVSSQYGSEHILAVKDFNNLRSLDLWPQTKDFPWMDIRIVSIYEHIKMSMDAISHVTFEGGDLINNLRYFSLEIDGQDFEPDKLNPICEEIEKMAIQIFQEFQALGFEKRKEKYYFQKSYAYKKVYDYLGQDWRPSADVLQEAQNKPLYKADWPKNTEDLRKLFKKIFDPYEEFPSEIHKAT